MLQPLFLSLIMKISVKYVVQNVNHEQADTVQIALAFDEFFRMSESEMHEFINGQQNKNTLQKTVRDVAIVTQFLKLKK